MLIKILSYIQKEPIRYHTSSLEKLITYEKHFNNCSFENDSVHGLLIQGISNLYYQTGDYLRAIEYQKKAIDFYKVNYSQNRQLLSGCYYNLFIYYDSLHLKEKKFESVDSCISVEMSAGNGFHFTSIVLTYKVNSLYYKGDYQSCYNYASLGEKLVPVYYHKSDSTSQLLFFIIYQINALYSLGKFTPAEILLRSHMVRFLSTGNNYYSGTMYGLLAFINKSKKEYGKSIDYFQKANQYYLKAKKKELSSQMLYQIGRVYFENLDSVNTGLMYYFKSLRNSDAADSFYLYGNIARVFVKLKRYDSSNFYFQESFNKIEHGIDETGILRQVNKYVNDNITENLVNIVLYKGDAFLQQYEDEKKHVYLEKALYVYKSADILLDKIREEQIGNDSKLFWPAYARRLYEHAVEASWLSNNPGSAFYFFEKNRAILLNEQLSQQDKTSETEIIRQADIKKNILWLERKRDTMDATSANYIEVQKQLFIYKDALKRMLQGIRDKNPLYFQSIPDTSNIYLSELQSKIREDHQEMLELFSGDSAIYSLLVTSGQVFFNKIEKTDFENTAHTFLNFLSNQSYLNSRFDQYLKTANHLYGLIFKNWPLIGSRIIISPDREIFPFEALVKNTNLAYPKYFIEDHSVSYTYSARYLLTHFATDSTKGPVSFFGLAPVQFDANTSLANLSGSDISLDRIGSYFSKATNLIGRYASRKNFQNQFSRFGIIQLYTHASDSSSQSEPVIYFADSALYLSDLIPENKPKTRLIVLSACETGSGKFYQGEGVFNFNRGFASLGIPTSITNLWSVDNLSTYKITELFYKFLSSGIPMDIALQKAKIEFIKQSSKEYSLPYYWAGSFLVGKSDPFANEKVFPWNEILVIICLIGVTYLIWQKQQ